MGDFDNIYPINYVSREAARRSMKRLNDYISEAISRAAEVVAEEREGAPADPAPMSE